MRAVHGIVYRRQGKYIVESCDDQREVGIVQLECIMWLETAGLVQGAVSADSTAEM